MTRQSPGAGGPVGGARRRQDRPLTGRATPAVASLAMAVAAVLAVLLLAGSGNLCASAETTSPARAPRPGSLAAYLDLVAQHRWRLSGGAATDATHEEMLSWRDKHAASAVGRLIKRLNGPEASRVALCDAWMNAESNAMVATGHVVVPLRGCDLAAPLRSAIALHTLTAGLALNRRETRRGLQELGFARALIAELPLAAGDFSRRARLTCAYLAQSHMLLGTALSFVRELPGQGPAGPETLLALAAAHESFALTCVSEKGDVLSNDGCRPLGPREKGRLSRDGLLALSEAHLRRALLLDPTLTNVRLRLGHILGVRGHSEARIELETVVATSDDPAERSLANLFLSRLDERSGRQAEGLEHARAAAREAPASRAARAALARALFMAGEREAAAAEAVDAVTSEPLPVDYYLLYRLGVPWFLGPAADELRANVW